MIMVIVIMIMITIMTAARSSIFCCPPISKPEEGFW